MEKNQQVALENPLRDRSGVDMENGQEFVSCANEEETSSEWRNKVGKEKEI